jgi:hypothetical protein
MKKNIKITYLDSKTMLKNLRLILSFYKKLVVLFKL